MLERFMAFVTVANDYLWGPYALVFLGAIGIYLTIGTKAVHLRKMGRILKMTVGKSMGKDKDEDETEGTLTSAQSMFTSLASVIGMGSIVGVASALINGGPGAIFWMWVAAFIGMIIKYAEIIIIVKYRKKTEDGTFVGGPGLYVKEGLGVSGVGEIIVIIMVLVCLTSTMIQSNVIVTNIVTMLPNTIVTSNPIMINRAVSILVLIFAAIVVIGGVKRLGVVAEKLIPFMSIFYLIGAVIVILFNFGDIVPALGQIIKGSFNPVTIASGFTGYGIMKAMQYGIARGFFVSGAGQAVFTVSHAPAKVKNPVEQAVYGVTEIFLVTIICTGTSLAILTSGVLSETGNAATMVTEAFTTVHPILGYAVGIAVVLFAYTTVIGFGYIGESQINTVTSNKVGKAYRLLYLIMAYFGGMGALSEIWDVTDFLLAIVMVINLIVLMLLSKDIFSISNDYWERLDNPKL